MDTLNQIREVCKELRLLASGQDSSEEVTGGVTFYDEDLSPTFHFRIGGYQSDIFGCGPSIEEAKQHVIASFERLCDGKTYQIRKLELEAAKLGLVLTTK